MFGKNAKSRWGCWLQLFLTHGVYILWLICPARECQVPTVPLDLPSVIQAPLRLIHVQVKEPQCAVVSWLCNPMDCSPPGSSSTGFPRQEYCSGLPLLSPRESSRPRDRTHVSCTSCTGRWVLYHWHPLGSPRKLTPRRWNECQKGIRKESTWPWDHPLQMGRV